MYFCDTAMAPAAAGMPIIWAAVAACDVDCTAATFAAGECTSPNNFLVNKGINIQNAAGALLMNRAPTSVTTLADLAAPLSAAFVIVSHGPSGGGGYTSSGALAPSETTDGTAEQGNYASLPYPMMPVVPLYTDDTFNETAGATHFDDIVLRPSILTILHKAGLQPRSHP
jgi:hypothetical protein